MSRPWTVRSRVTALATWVVAAVLVVMALVLVVVQNRTLGSALDDAVGRRADDIAAQLAEGRIPALPGVDDEDATQVVSLTGSVVAASPNLQGVGALAADPSFAGSPMTVRIAALPDEAFRMVSRRVETPDGTVTLHVAVATDDVRDSVRILVVSLLVAIPLAVAALGGAVWWLVGRALAPVGAIRAEVESIGEGELHRRVPEPTAEDEVGRLARTMNRMLERLDLAVRRQQQFVADASHELRSPLTRIRTEIEVDLKDPHRADYQATHRSVLEEVGGMEQLVEDLLYLARSDSGRHPLRSTPVDLDDLVLIEVRRMRSMSGLEVDATAVGAAQVSGDRAALARAIRNLCDNALRHADRRIAVSLGEYDGRAILSIADDGPGIDPSEHERIFERFGRSDEGRSRSEGGTGLGLSIVRDVVERHGGFVAVDAGHAPGARFVVSIPIPL